MLQSAGWRRADSFGRLAEAATRTRGLSPNMEEMVSQCHPMSPEDSGRGSLVPRGLLGRESICLHLSRTVAVWGGCGGKAEKLPSQLATLAATERMRGAGGKHPRRRRRFSDAIRAWLHGSDGLTFAWPRRCSGASPSGLSFVHPPEVIRLAGAGPTPSGGSLRQLLVPEVLARTWRKW
jgi:hypothetical protein